jgi:malonyl-CoA decarboxylase
MAVPQQAAASSATIPRRSWLERLWTTIVDRGEQYVDGPAASIPPRNGSRDLDPAARFEFFQFLASGFLPEQKRLRKAASAYLEEPSPDRVMMLAEASEPPRQELLRRINMSPGGTPA